MQMYMGRAAATNIEEADDFPFQAAYSFSLSLYLLLFTYFYILHCDNQERRELVGPFKMTNFTWTQGSYTMGDTFASHMSSFLFLPLHE